MITLNRNPNVFNPGFFHEFERLEFKPAPSPVLYEEFDGGHRLHGTVHTEDGESYTGDIRWDDDEEFYPDLFPGEYVRFTVKDTGDGMSPETMERIFDPFYTRKKTMGMGVGLSICHGIIEEHHGSISVTNGPDGGAIFTVTLPIYTSVDAPENTLIDMVVERNV